MFGATAGAASAHRAADVCANAGLSTTEAVKAYGQGARVASLPLIGYGPADLMNVPACFVYGKGNVVVATVQRYPRKDWSDLLAIYRGLHAKQSPLAALGSGAVLFDVLARARNYEEVVLFFGGGSVVAARLPLIVSDHPPVVPPTRLMTLLRGVRVRLAD